MYLEHYGLKRPPFKITPDTSLFYKGNKRGAALEALKYAIVSGEGIIKVVGEVGSGKTMLCRMLELELADQLELVYIANPSLSPDNILHVIAFELKLDVDNDSSKLEVMQKLQHYLLQQHAHNRQVVVFVEEAQGMPLETLEEIRLLSNLETNDYKLLQMVLFGQPELDENLRQPSIRQLKERITHSFYLDPFPKDDIYEYLNFRMRAVGYRGPDIFSQKAASNIEKRSSGLTRRINIIADKALMAAFCDGGHDISSKHIDIAASDSDFGQAINWKPWAKAGAFIAVILSAVWLGTQITSLSGYQQSTQQDTVNQVPVDMGNETPEQAIQTFSQEEKTVLPATQELSLLQMRLNETQQWMRQSADSDITIQLAIIDQWAANKTESFIQSASKRLGENNIFVYKAMIQGRPVYSLLFSRFGSRQQAIDAMVSMHASMKVNKPYLRTLKRVKADITKSRKAG